MPPVSLFVEQVLLSGAESRAMTHGLRSVHDAILVGAGTIRQDNPRYAPAWALSPRPGVGRPGSVGAAGTAR